MKTVFLVLFLFTNLSIAAPLFTNSSVVTTVHNQATFDSITSSISLSGYAEDGIVIDINDISGVNFDAFGTGSVTALHYGASGNNSWVTISRVDNDLIFALDFLLGDGFMAAGGSTTNLIWETFSGITSTGFGDIGLNKGSTVGWEDSLGFTSIRVAANGTTGINAFGEFQAIALDNVNVGSVSSVPAPAAVWLLGSGLIGLIGIRKNSIKLSSKYA